MIELIEQWDDVAGEVRAIGDRDHALADVRLHAPILRPGKIYALVLNYRQHVAEMGRELPAHQTWFTKPGPAVKGTYDRSEELCEGEEWFSTCRAWWSSSK